MLQGWPAAVLAPTSLLPAAAIVLETVRPDPRQPELEEYRLGLALLPVRLRLNQDVIAFLVTFCGAVSEAVAAVENPLTAAVAAAAAAAEAAAAADDGSGGGTGGVLTTVQPPYFQKVVIWGTGVSVDYCPRTVDIAALRDGDFLELLNLVPWGGVDLALKPLRFNGLVGWDGLAAAAAQEWMSHVGRTQAHKFLTGVAPIRSVVRVGGAVAALLAGPAASLQDVVGDVVLSATRSVAAGIAAAQAGSGNTVGLTGSSNAAKQLQERLKVAAAAAAAAAGRAAGAAGRCGVGGSASGSSDAVASRLRQSMQQSTAGFARMLLYEALGAGATVAAGAELLLAGSSGARGGVSGTSSTGSSSSRASEAAGTVGSPAGLVEGLRAAAGELQGGFKTAAEALVGGPVRGYQGGAYPSWQAAAAEALRAAPAAAAAPAKGLAAAARTALLGAQKAVGGGQQQ
jgi:autophagy-related protein 2